MMKSYGGTLRGLVETPKNLESTQDSEQIIFSQNILLDYIQKFRAGQDSN